MASWGWRNKPKVVEKVVYVEKPAEPTLEQRIRNLTHEECMEVIKQLKAKKEK